MPAAYAFFHHGEVSSLQSEARHVVVSADDLRALVESVLVKYGARPAEATIQTNHWLEGDLRDQPSHGVQRLPTLVGRIAHGRVNCAAAPKLRWTTESVLTVDGDNGFGPVVAYEAIDQLIHRAQHTGVAVALLSRANHLGMLAPYVEALAAAGKIGLVLTTTEALVHPWGGAEAMVGTNPIALAVPAEPDAPLALDLATSATSAGRVLHHARNGLPLPAGWAVDQRGAPTTNAAAAVHGAISPFGGPKGYALGVGFGALVGALTGTAFGTQVTGTLDETEPTTKGDIIMCFDPLRLGLPDVPQRTAAYLAELRSSRPADKSAPVQVPGDRARQARQRRQREGIPLDHTLWRTINDLAHPSGGPTP